ncbi:hypothetical protein AB3S75_012399 [Citrus x aurantiifolia]
MMLLGFISLVLTSRHRYISKIFLPAKVADTMLLCKAGRMDMRQSNEDEDEDKEIAGDENVSKNKDGFSEDD